MISVILPVVNESARIARTLAALGPHRLSEVIVVDGGSTDDTPAIVSTFPEVRLLNTGRGRGRQMNLGASVSSGDILLFLHADALLPPDAILRIGQAMADPGVVFGAFRVRTIRDAGPTPSWLRLADLRSRFTKLPYGDQAIFVRRSAFLAAGGYPDQPIFEDLELSRRLGRLGRYARLDAEVLVSARRWEISPVRTTLLMNALPLLYALGVGPERLARWYRDAR